MIVITASVVTEDPGQIARVAEVLARAAAGFALDGISASVSFGVVEDDDDGDDGEVDAPDPHLWYEREREPTLTGLPILP